MPIRFYLNVIDFINITSFFNKNFLNLFNINTTNYNNLVIKNVKKNKKTLTKFFFKYSLKKYRIFKFKNDEYIKHFTCGNLYRFNINWFSKLKLIGKYLKLNPLTYFRVRKVVKKNKLKRLKTVYFIKINRHFNFKKNLFCGFKDSYLWKYGKFESIVNLKVKNKYKIKYITVPSKLLYSRKTSPYHLFNLLYFMNYGFFRNYNYNIIVRYNRSLKLYIFIKNNVEFLFRAATFPKSYLYRLIDSFTFMCFTKTINVFSLYIRRIVSRLGRVGQRNFYYSFNCIDYSQMTTFFKKLFIFGFFMKSTGKIAGYVADRTKTFFVRFGNCSRSNKIFKYTYKQILSITKSGSIGTNLLLVYK